MRNILVVVGESSGELYAELFLKAWKKRGGEEVSFWGIGGERTSSQGMEAVGRVAELSLLGLWEILRGIPRIFALKRKILKEAALRRPSAALLIDSPDFNLPLAKGLQAMGIPVLIYVAPTVWAWRYGRVKTLRRVAEKVLLLYPFEEKILREAGVPCRFIGHPLLTEARGEGGEGNGRRVKEVLLLPGSRVSELKRHTEPLLKAIKALEESLGEEIRFTLLQAPYLSESLFAPFRRAGVTLSSGPKYPLMERADLVLASSGTANLEIALMGRPMVVFYRVSTPTYLLGRILLKVRSISIVNLLLGKRVVPEVIQGDFTGERLAGLALELLKDPSRAEVQVKAFEEIKRAYDGVGDPSGSVVEEVSLLLAREGRPGEESPPPPTRGNVT